MLFSGLPIDITCCEGFSEWHPNFIVSLDGVTIGHHKVERAVARVRDFFYTGNISVTRIRTLKIVNAVTAENSSCLLYLGKMSKKRVTLQGLLSKN